MPKGYDANMIHLLVGLAVLYGHTISWGNRGNWVWDEKNKRCWLENILGTDQEASLLTCIFPDWDTRRKYGRLTGGGLLYRYHIILVYYYNDHPEEKKLK